MPTLWQLNKGNHRKFADIRSWKQPHYVIKVPLFRSGSGTTQDDWTENSLQRSCRRHASYLSPTRKL